MDQDSDVEARPKRGSVLAGRVLGLALILSGVLWLALALVAAALF